MKIFWIFVGAIFLSYIVINGVIEFLTAVGGDEDGICDD